MCARPEIRHGGTGISKVYISINNLQLYICACANLAGAYSYTKSAMHVN